MLSEHRAGPTRAAGFAARFRSNRSPARPNHRPQCRRQVRHLLGLGLVEKRQQQLGRAGRPRGALDHAGDVVPTLPPLSLFFANTDEQPDHVGPLLDELAGGEADTEHVLRNSRHAREADGEPRGPETPIPWTLTCSKPG